MTKCFCNGNIKKYSLNNRECKTNKSDFSQWKSHVTYLLDFVNMQKSRHAMYDGQGILSKIQILISNSLVKMKTMCKITNVIFGESNGEVCLI